MIRGLGRARSLVLELVCRLEQSLVLRLIRSLAETKVITKLSRFY